MIFVCRKDKKASDSMDEACDIVELPWYLKRAIGFVNDLEVGHVP